MNDSAVQVIQWLAMSTDNTASANELEVWQGICFDFIAQLGQFTRKLCLFKEQRKQTTGISSRGVILQEKLHIRA